MAMYKDWTENVPQKSWRTIAHDHFKNIRKCGFVEANHKEIRNGKDLCTVLFIIFRNKLLNAFSSSCTGAPCVLSFVSGLNCSPSGARCPAAAYPLSSSNKVPALQTTQSKILQFKLFVMLQPPLIFAALVAF